MFQPPEARFPQARIPYLIVAEGSERDHRQRLLTRIRDLQSSASTELSDRQLVQLLLLMADWQTDPDIVADQLLEHFGSLSQLIAADVDEMLMVDGLDINAAALLRAMHFCMLKMLAQPLQQQPILSSWPALLDYLRADMAHLARERVRILHLDSKNRLVRDELMSEGSIDQAAIYPREVIHRALTLGSAALIIVHNHPSGDVTPSRQDIKVTKDIMAAGRKLGIALHDHLIIGRHGHFSFRARGLI